MSDIASPHNLEYIEEQYQRFRDDPDAVDPSWKTFFEGFELGMGVGGVPECSGAVSQAEKQSRVASLIFGYRNLGHRAASIDPLDDVPPPVPDLQLEAFGLDEVDLDVVFDTGHLGGEMEGGAFAQQATLGQILEVLRDTYCRAGGVEYLHIQDMSRRRWLQAQMEPSRNRPEMSRGKKLEILRKLVDATLMETFIGQRYLGQKRFSLEGAETLIPAVHALVEQAGAFGVQEVIIGMAHRGRLNMLTNIMQKSYADVFAEFEDILQPAQYGGDGDVKYHKGYSSDHVTASGQSVHLSLTANPSHLEAVNPVVEGRARAKQRRLDDTAERKRVVPLLIHGDAAFAGQGLVAETLNLSQLPGYRTGGTVHFIINNQIGFTTTPEEARSTTYCTDVAKMIQAPIFHVNGDDPEAVVHAMELAMGYRQVFGCDVVVDMVCYRRHGHNEGDEPGFTQPLLYREIKGHPPVLELYTRGLVESGDLAVEQQRRIAAAFKDELQRAFEEVKKAEQAPAPPEAEPYRGNWSGMADSYCHASVMTNVPAAVLREVAEGITRVPEGFSVHRKLARQLDRKQQIVQQGGDVDWALGEALAFGSLLLEGLPVRLSGQDSARGTFSHRHAAWQDVKTGQSHVPLKHLHADQASFCVYNSLLSEAAVLGFDYGYAMDEPHMLILWEAQFGDFANGAQVIIDQFLVASQSKWQRQSGLVMLLPHGYEGQGPEHSNAYLERYLAACAEDNIQVCNLTTPAQYFHVLRRQLKRGFRRPLVVMSPKSLLRHPRCVSPLRHLSEGGFSELLDDAAAPDAPRRLLLCSGKVYYDLVAAREEGAGKDVAIVRVEQLYPVCAERWGAVARRYADVPEVCWVQEESRNRGAWSFIHPRLSRFFPGRDIGYIGRPASASPATGSLGAHRREQAKIIETSLGS